MVVCPVCQHTVDYTDVGLEKITCPECGSVLEVIWHSVELMGISREKDRIIAYCRHCLREHGPESLYCERNDKYLRFLRNCLWRDCVNGFAFCQRQNLILVLWRVAGGDEDLEIALDDELGRILYGRNRHDALGSGDYEALASFVREQVEGE